MTDDTHGSEEHGADVILSLKQMEDPLGIGQYFFIQTKVTDIKLPDWRNISGQLLELCHRPPMLLNSDRSLSRRVIFITSRRILQPVVNEIIHWNDSEYIPIEALDGKRFAKLMIDKKYRIEDFSEDIKEFHIRPIQKSPLEAEQQIIKVGEDHQTIDVARIGDVKSKINKRAQS